MMSVVIMGTKRRMLMISRHNVLSVHCTDPTVSHWQMNHLSPCQRHQMQVHRNCTVHHSHPVSQVVVGCLSEWLTYCWGIQLPREPGNMVVPVLMISGKKFPWPLLLGKKGARAMSYHSISAEKWDRPISFVQEETTRKQKPCAWSL